MKRRQLKRLRQHGAALLAAMLTVTLIATFAAAALWQQWRTLEIESAERARIQSAWILVGALDWSRLILREDGRTGGADHLAEPWATPLQEARLSTFLTAERGVSQVDDNTTDTANAFLSGSITDMQGRLNLRNLGLQGQIQPATLAKWRRLFDLLSLPVGELNALAQGMTEASKTSSTVLLPQDVDQLTWWGLSPATVQRLAPFITILPVRTPVNLNTASAEVLYASIEGINLSQARQLVSSRELSSFASLGDAQKHLDGISLSSEEHAIATSFFEVRGQLRLGDNITSERSLVQRNGIVVTTLWRERIMSAPGVPRSANLLP